MASSAETRPTDWKDKYFQAINDYESQVGEQARHLADVQRDLCAILERFSGHHELFDRALVEARAAIDADPNEAISRSRALVTSFERFFADDAPQEAAGSNSTSNTDLEAVRASLRVAFDQLSLPAPANRELEPVAAALESASNLEAMHAAAARMANVVVGYASTLHADLQALGRFLVGLNERLAEFSRHVNDEDLARREGASARAELDRVVRGSLDTLRDTMQDATDIDQIRQDIGVELAALDGGVTRFLSSETARADSAEARASALAERLDSLDGETKSLRAQLAEARARASEDALTGLPNRFAYDARLTAELARSRRASSPLSLAVFDLDRFKQINDGYGHQAGDRVLKKIARLIEARTRGQDFFARFGGEEFVLLMPDTALDGARSIVEALRQQVEACQFKFKDQPLNVTVSCGVTEFGATESADDTFKRADEALYEAKSAGRNRSIAVPA